MREIILRPVGVAKQHELRLKKAINHCFLNYKIAILQSGVIVVWVDCPTSRGDG